MPLLEQTLQETDFKTSLLQRLRNNYSTKLTLLSLVGSLYLANCSSSRQQEGCNTDSDCPGEQVCNNYQCASGSCTNDYQCPGEQLCENSACRNPTAETISTPEKTYNKFVETLSAGNLEQAVTYFHPLTQKGYREILAGKNLTELGGQLGRTAPSNCSGDKLKECDFTIDGDEHKIQFLLFEENGQKIYKIRNL